MNEIKLATSVAVSTTGLIGNTFVISILLTPKFKKESLFRCLLIATIVYTINSLTFWPFNYRDELNSIKIVCKFGLHISLESLDNRHQLNRSPCC